MTSGVMIDGTGKIAAVVHGWTGKGAIPAGHTFQAVADVTGLSAGQAPPAKPLASVVDRLAAVEADNTVLKADLAQLVATVAAQSAQLGVLAK
jgi:hypothetical protein